MDRQRMPARVALLQSGGHRHNKVVLQLLDCLASDRIDIDVNHPTTSLPQQLAGCDLILFEAIGPVNQEQQAILHKIRADSYAPVVMLTTGIKGDHMIDGLLAGADAVIPLNTAHDVIVAHCQALVRRWRTVCLAARTSTN